MAFSSDFFLETVTPNKTLIAFSWSKFRHHPAHGFCCVLSPMESEARKNALLFKMNAQCLLPMI